MEPDAAHWFGTDQSGRDVLSRVIWGAARVAGGGGVRRRHRRYRSACRSAWSPAWVRGGWLEQAIMRVLEAISAIPILIWAIALVGIFGVRDARSGR